MVAKWTSGEVEDRSFDFTTQYTGGASNSICGWLIVFTLLLFMLARKNK